MTVRLLVRGRVQGVGFRYFTLRRATELGLSGFVQNLPDGSVEVVANGSVEQLDALEASLRVGPRSANVVSVEKSEISDEVVGSNSFTVK